MALNGLRHWYVSDIVKEGCGADTLSKFSLSTKLELACATLDMFLIGIKDIFLRMGIGILEVCTLKEDENWTDFVNA